MSERSIRGEAVIRTAYHRYIGGDIGKTVDSIGRNGLVFPGLPAVILNKDKKEYCALAGSQKSIFAGITPPRLR